MTFYSIVLFVHVVSVLALSVVLGFEILSLSRLRRASTLSEAQYWMSVVPGMGRIAMGSLLVILVSGIYLARQMFAFEMAWPKVTIAALLLIAPFGAMSGRRMRAIRRVSGVRSATMSELLIRIQDPFLKISLGIRIAVFLGIALLMASKPQLWQAISIVAASVIMGLLVPFLTGRRYGPSLPPDAVQGRSKV